MKKGVKNLIRAVSFFAVLILSVVSFSYMLAPKDNTKGGGHSKPQRPRLLLRAEKYN